VERLSGSHFLGYIQTHDQVGNRANGERIEHLVGPELAKVAAALVMCSPFVPMVFQGEEFAASSPFLYFSDHQEPEIGTAVSEGRQREFAAFGWNPNEVPDPQNRATFEKSKLDWSEIEREPHRGMLEWYRQLIALRCSKACLVDGHLDRVRVDFREDERWLVLHRGPISVACNFAGISREIREIPASGHRVLLSSHPSSSLDGGTLRLAPHSAAILEAD